MEVAHRVVANSFMIRIPSAAITGSSSDRACKSRPNGELPGIVEPFTRSAADLGILVELRPYDAPHIDADRFESKAPGG